jgi:formyltetrahydrofolate synthetase
VASKNALLNERLVGAVAETAVKAVAMMDEQLEHDRERPVGERQIPLEKLSDVSERLLKSLGYGGRQAAASTVVNVSQHIDTGANPEALRVISQRLQAKQAAPTESLTEKDRERFHLQMDEVHLVAGDDLDPELIRRTADE